MIRTVMAAMAALFITTAGASAQVKFPFWLGTALVDTVTPQCANGGFVGRNDIISSAFRAKVGITGEPAAPGINFYRGPSAYSYIRFAGTSDANTMNGSGSAKGILIRGNVTMIPSQGQLPYNTTFNFSVSPATIDGTTQTITIDGWINNWRNVTGCKVTFRAAYRLGAWQ